MKTYKRLQIIKHALQYYINREGADQNDVDQEKRVLEDVEHRVGELKERYGIGGAK